MLNMAGKHKGKELKGRVKEATGDLTRNKKLQLKGKADQALVLGKRTGGNVKKKATQLAAKLRATGFAGKLKA